MDKPKLVQSKHLPLALIDPNTGQIDGLPKNPRLIRDRNFKKLKQSIEDNPEMTALREILVFPQGDRYVIIGGNMRYEAMKSLGLETAPCKVIPADTPVEKLRQIVLKDNSGFGEWDYDLLGNEWDKQLIDDCCIDVPHVPTLEEMEEEKRQEEEEALVRDLRKAWIVPPMSVFDTRSGEWQTRKKLWRQLVNNKTIGETREATLYPSLLPRYPQLYKKSQAEREKLGISFREYIENYATEEDLKLDGAFAAGTSLFDPVLAEVVMKWFAPKNGKIIDPFGGEPTKGIVAGVLGYNYVAVEFREEQVETNQRVCINYPNVQYYHGDSNNIDQIVKEGEFDLCFTSLPYYDLEVYSKDDLSALGSYEEFMENYHNIFKKCVEKLKDDSFLVVKVGEIRNKKTGVYRNFVGDNITIFKDLGLNYWNEIILVNPVGTACLRAEKGMETRKVQHVHQNILVFKKDQHHQVNKCHDNLLVFYKGQPKGIKREPLENEQPLEMIVKQETEPQNED